MNPQRLQYLFEKYFDKTASLAERTELNEVISNEANKEEILELFASAWEKYQGDGTIITTDRSNEILLNILSKDRIEKGTDIRIMEAPKRSIGWRNIAAAAVIIIMLGAGAYFYFNKKQVQTEIVTAPLIHDVKAPIANRALITLSNGQKVFLDSAVNGTLAKQGKTNIVKTADGQIAYNNENKTANEIFYNTLSNPRGSKVINLTLSDGTKVWLNAESSLTYPTAFADKERKVEITGEAYFEVAHDAAKPFFVSKGSMSVQVLGTHFNVNGYDDEAVIKVTLLEGSVKVASAKGGELQEATIIPGEQAQVGSLHPTLSKAGGIINVMKDVNTEEVVAWKNGLFRFNDASIQTILQQAARWYDVDLEYKTDIRLGFVATISRDVPISKLLKILELTDRVHFRIEGRKITVLP